MRTKAEVDRQIEGLLRERNSKSEFNLYGQSNWLRYDYVIGILKGEIEYIELPEDHDDYDENYDLAGFEAVGWLQGVYQEDLFTETGG